MTPDQIDITFIAQLLRVWWLVADETQSRNAAALLIDGDDWLDLTQVAQIVDQFAQLRRALDVASEENEPAGLDAPKQFCASRVEIFAGNATDYQLAKRIRTHSPKQ